MTVKDPAGAPIPLTGVVAAQIRKARNDVASLVAFTADLTDAAIGVVLLSLTGTQTAALLNGTGAPFAGVFDVQWTATGEQPVTLLQGGVTCELDVTRP